MVRFALALLLASALETGGTALAQPVGGEVRSPAAAAPSQTRPLTCADFHRQPDGSWSPRRPVVVGGVALTPVMSFTRGVSFGGVDIAAALEAHCRSLHGP